MLQGTSVKAGVECTWQAVATLESQLHLERFQDALRECFPGGRANLGRETPHELAIRGLRRTISGPQDTNGESLSN
jgi:hypothetical protein